MANSIPLIRQLTNLILYSSLWIGACAAALVIFTYDVTGSGMHPGPYVGFVFCGTVALYAIHRLTGIEIVKQFPEKGRFVIIYEHRSHIKFYGMLGTAGAMWFLIHLPMHLVWWLVLPGFFSLMYAVPIAGKRRWRDYSMIKIFLIAVVWATLTGVIPLVQTGLATWPSGIFIFLERALFIFAITIPFDIRDYRVDLVSDVKTFPILLGIRRSKVLAIWTLCASAVLTFVIIGLNIYDDKLVFPYLFCWTITAALIWYSAIDLDDHYYSGILDGTMFLIPFAYWIATLL